MAKAQSTRDNLSFSLDLIRVQRPHQWFKQNSCIVKLKGLRLPRNCLTTFDDIMADWNVEPLLGVSVDWAGCWATEKPDLAAGGDGLHHHQAEAGAAGQGQHCGDSPAADQDEDVHESHNSKEPNDGSSGWFTRWVKLHEDIFYCILMVDNNDCSRY